MKMNILVDDAMPYWQTYFADFTVVRAFKAGTIFEQDLHNIQVLLVRSTTKVNQDLLNKMPNLQFVGTATAGFDHFDTAALESRGIVWTAAGGCNASAVTQYVVCALLHLACADKFLLTSKKVGIVGNGNVGKRLRTCLLKLGIDVLSYDPPLARDTLQTTSEYVSFNELLTCDIICLHAPLNSDVQFPSEHMFDANVLQSLSAKQYLINAGRGELIDNQALLRLKSQKPNDSVQVVLDVWENEPSIERKLIPFCRLASAHIAGHTLDGKAAGTHILYEKFCQYINQPVQLKLSALLPEYNLSIYPLLQEHLNDKNIKDLLKIQAIVKQVCFCVYDIANDDSVFRRYMAQSTSFAELRQQYSIRREFSASKLVASNYKIQEYLVAIGFIISNGSITPP